MNIAKIKLSGSPLSSANISKTTEHGRNIRQAREQMRAALDAGKKLPGVDGSFYFTNETLSECLAIGPTFRFRIAA